MEVVTEVRRRLKNGTVLTLRVPVRNTLQIQARQAVSLTKIPTFSADKNILHDLIGKERTFTLEFPVVDRVEYFPGRPQTILSFLEYFTDVFDKNKEGSKYELQLKNSSHIYEGLSTETTLLWDSVKVLKCTVVLVQGDNYLVDPSQINQNIGDDD